MFFYERWNILECQMISHILSKFLIIFYHQQIKVVNYDFYGSFIGRIFSLSLTEEDVIPFGDGTGRIISTSTLCSYHHISFLYLLE